MLQVYWTDVQRYMEGLPTLLIAFGAFVIGWFVAWLVSALVRSLLSKIKWDDKLFQFLNVPSQYQPETVISKVVYYLLLIAALIAALQVLKLDFIAQPLAAIIATILTSVPALLKAALILLAGWIIASAVRLLIQRGGTALRIHQLLKKWKAVDSDKQAEQTLKGIGNVLFYLILLLFLPGVLNALSITAISGPISQVVESFLLFIPKLFAAALTVLIGWVVARIAREITSKVLDGVGLDRLADKLQLTKVIQNTSLSSIAGTIVYILILIPTVITALQTLELTGISEPAVNMLQVVLTMLPSVFVAILLVLIGIWVGRWICTIVTGILERLGFNSLFQTLGLTRWSDASSLTLSQVVGNFARIVVILLFTVQALNVVRLQFLVEILQAIIAYLPNFLVAILIVGIGLYLGTLVYNLLSQIVHQDWKFLIAAARYGILTVSIFMALNQLGVARTIVDSAFIILLSGVTVAFALAFGLGGKQVAAELLEQWLRRARSQNSQKPSGTNDDSSHSM